MAAAPTIWSSRALAAICAASCLALVRLLARARALEAELAAARAATAREGRLRLAERAGRTAAERALRAAATAAAPAAAAEEPWLRGWRVIGRVSSPFSDRRGTPRQGLLASRALASLRLDPSVVEPSALDGLEAFSHVWVLFVFHQNTNGCKLGGGRHGGRSVKAKVHPPRLGGAKTGLFATRTPHRPNPLGLSLARLDGVRRGEAGGGARLLLSGVDLVDGTPVLDVKPWLPLDCPVRLPPSRLMIPAGGGGAEAGAPARQGGAEARPRLEWHVPDWCAAEEAPPLRAVRWSDAALAGCAEHAGSLRHYGCAAEWRQAAEQLILLDPRAVYQGRVQGRMSGEADAGASGAERGGREGGRARPAWAAGGAGPLAEALGEEAAGSGAAGGYALRFDGLELRFGVRDDLSALVAAVCAAPRASQLPPALAVS